MSEIKHEKQIYFGSKDEVREVKRFGDLATGFDYGVGAEALEFDGNVKYIRITDIDEDGYYNPTKYTTPSTGFDTRYLVNTNDILLARTGASVGKSYLYNVNDGELIFAGFLIRANICNINPYFFYSFLKTSNYWRQVSIMSARSGQPGINSQEYKQFKINVPTKNVDKYGKLLYSIDYLIDKTKKERDLFENIL